MRTCIKCGAELGPEARYCPRCGTANVILVERKVKPAPRVASRDPAGPQPPTDAAPAVAPPRSSSAPWWIVPVVIVGLIALALVFTSRRTTEYDGVARDDNKGTSTAPAQRPANTGTLVPINESAASGRPASLTPATPAASSQAPPPASGVAAQPVTTAGARPPGSIAPQQPITTTSSPGPVAAVPPRQRSVPPPTPDVRTGSVTAAAPSTSTPETSPAPATATAQAPPQPQPPEPARHRAGVSEREAIAIARDFMLDNDVYDVGSDCLSIRSNGYVNVGYTLEAWDICASGGSGRLGRWRVDALTGQLFRQDEDGRYKKP